MRDDRSPPADGNNADPVPEQLALRLVALAREARLLEFALDGNSDSASALAASLQSALESAMEAETPDDLASASDELRSALGLIVDRGMTLSAELTDVVVEGVLGASRMTVLTAVLTA